MAFRQNQAMGGEAGDKTANRILDESPDLTIDLRRRPLALRVNLLFAKQHCPV